MIGLMLQSIENDEDRVFLLELYDKYNGMIRGKAMGIVKNAWDMEDIEQEVVIKMINCVDTLKQLNCRQMTAYLSILVKNASIDIYNKNRKQQNFEVTYELLENKISDENCNYRELKDMNGFKELDNQTAKILYEKYVEKATIKEIAMRYNLPQGTVATIINRGKEKFRIHYNKGEL